MTIHERIIARLEGLRKIWAWSNLNAQRELREDPTSMLLIDMAIEDVRRKCPKCEDTGIWEHSISTNPEQAWVKDTCHCGRKLYLEECERRLNG